VYIAGPYSLGDVAENVRKAVQAANAVLDLGAVPYLPHTTHLWHLISPKPHEFWLWYDLRWLRHCDVVYRLPGESKGADAEEEFAGRMGIRVVHSIDDLRQFLWDWWNPEAHDRRA
jgi:hypothetical protein